MGDIDEVFLNEEEFAEPVQIVYSDGITVSTKGIFDNDFISIDPETNATTQALNPHITVSTAVLPKRLGPNDHAIIRGVNYRVIEARDDGTGITDIFFQHNTHEDIPGA